MNSNLKLEKKILNISFIGSLLFLIAEIIISIITKSHSVFTDVIFDCFDLLMIGPFLLLIPLLYKSETEKRPYGYSQIESLFIMFKTGALIVISVLLIINNFFLILNGGNSVDASLLAVFELCVSFTCIIMYFVLSKLSKNYSSPSIDAELYIWKLDSYSTLGVGLAFLIQIILENTNYAFIGNYIDPTIAIILAVLLLKEPLGLFTESIHNLILFAPPKETRNKIKNTIAEVLEKENCYINFLDIIKTGRKLWVEVYFVKKEDIISINKLRKLHDEIYDKLKDEYDDLYIELIPDIEKVKAANIKKMNRRPDKVNYLSKKNKKK